MSRTGSSAYAPVPPDRERSAVLRFSRWEYDENVLVPISDAEHRIALEQTLWPLLEGHVIQPHCMCGAWSSAGQCEDCREELALDWRRDAAGERYRRSYHSEVRKSRGAALHRREEKRRYSER